MTGDIRIFAKRAEWPAVFAITEDLDPGLKVSFRDLLPCDKPWFNSEEASEMAVVVIRYNDGYKENGDALATKLRKKGFSVTVAEHELRCNQ